MMSFVKTAAMPSYMVPGFEHGIGMMGDEWRIGLNDGPFPYWTNPITLPAARASSAHPSSLPGRNIGFRYENPILITPDGCEAMSRFPLAIEDI